MESGRCVIDVTHAYLGKNTVELGGQIRGTVFLPVTQALTDECASFQRVYPFQILSPRLLYESPYMSDDAARYDGVAVRLYHYEQNLVDRVLLRLAAT